MTWLFPGLKLPLLLVPSINSVLIAKLNVVKAMASELLSRAELLTLPKVSHARW